MIMLILLVLILLIFVLDIDDLKDAFRILRFEPLILGTLCMIAGMLLISVRWRYILDNQVS